MLKEILYVGLGSAIGGILRYLTSLAMKGFSASFPFATLFVNVVGCLLIGLFSGLIARHFSSSTLLSCILVTGICGGFTTFSSFSKDCLILLETGHSLYFVIYIATSIVAGISSVLLGIYLTRL